MAQPAPPRALYDGTFIAVRAVPGESPKAVATFYPRAGKDLKTGFGESFFASRGRTAVHFLPKKNHWWQTEEMDAAILAATEFLRGETDGLAMTYGASMGGLGALLFAQRLGAERALSLSPQASLYRDDLDVMAGWKLECAPFPERYRLEKGILAGVKTRVFADPFYPFDMKHVNAVREVGDIEFVPVPFSAHFTARLLQDIGMLGSTVLSNLDESFDPGEFRSSFRARRGKSMLYWINLIAQTSRHPRVTSGARKVLDLRLMEAIERADPKLPHRFAGGFVRGRAARLAQNGQVPEAMELASRYSCAYPNEPMPQYIGASLLESWSHYEEAAAGMNRAIRLDKHNPLYRIGLVQILCKQGHYDQANVELKGALNTRMRPVREWVGLANFLALQPVDEVLKEKVQALAQQIGRKKA